jgi:hypothetical protein
VLYGLVMRERPGTVNERATRRLQWHYPEGATPVAEYWFATEDPSVVAIAETDDPKHHSDTIGSAIRCNTQQPTERKAL